MDAWKDPVPVWEREWAVQPRLKGQEDKEDKVVEHPRGRVQGLLQGHNKACI